MELLRQGKRIKLIKLRIDRKIRNTNRHQTMDHEKQALLVARQEKQ